MQTQREDNEWTGKCTLSEVQPFIWAEEYKDLEAKPHSKIEGGALPKREGQRSGQNGSLVRGKRAGNKCWFLEQVPSNQGGWGRTSALQRQLSWTPAREAQGASRGYQHSRALSSWGQNDYLL